MRVGDGGIVVASVLFQHPPQNTWSKQNESLNDEPEQEQEFGVVSFQVPVMKAPTLAPLGGGMRKKTVSPIHILRLPTPPTTHHR